MGRASLPHIVTGLVAIALALSIQALLPTPTPAIAPPVRPTSAPARTPQASAAPATPAAALPQPDQRILSQEIVDLRVQINEVWSGMYIARAANQLADAEAALRGNDTVEVERVLVAVDTSLGLAYDRSGELNKAPIGEFRVQVGQIRDDLDVRPEGLDQRLRLLRQRMLSLIEEP